MQDYFVEQLGNMVVGAGVVRLDFMRIEAGDAGNAGRLQPGLRLVIPLPAFAQAVDSMITLRDQLVADGVLTRTESEVIPALKN
ncbi:MAG: hypothetical protein D4R74_08940 [Betaproteobacteria bacterium]|nr:MAG: hypothetical protein D4R74_08940 [Betaproteobacteria bacterium]